MESVEVANIKRAGVPFETSIIIPASLYFRADIQMISDNTTQFKDHAHLSSALGNFAVMESLACSIIIACTSSKMCQYTVKKARRYLPSICTPPAMYRVIVPIELSILAPFDILENYRRCISICLLSRSRKPIDE